MLLPAGAYSKPLRDLHEHVSAKKIDAFFIALDFHKAFDSVNHNFLRQALSRMALPTHFCKILVSINRNATSQVLVNGFLTQPVKLNRGVRQGDPLSMLLFLPAAEPLAMTLKSQNDIQGIEIPGKHVITSCIYADDATLTLVNASSVKAAFQHVVKYEQACGLQINLKKTNGLHCRPSTASLNNLLPIPWTKLSLPLLCIVIGSPSGISSEWNRVFSRFKTEVKKLSAYTLTHNAKALLTKSKLLPLITYTAHIYQLSAHQRREISNKIENFIAGDSRLILPRDTLELPLNQGGYTVPNIALYCDILYLKPLAEYCQHRKENTELTPSCALINIILVFNYLAFYQSPSGITSPTQNLPTSYTHTHWRSAKKYNLSFEELRNFQILAIYNSQIATKRNSNPPTTGTQ